MRKLLLLLVVMLALGVVPVVDAGKEEIGLYMLNLGKFDVGTGAFTADFYLSMLCEQECSAAGFEFMNGRALSTDKLIDEPNEKFYRIQAGLTSPVDLKSFPFDKQKMEIIIENRQNSIDELEYYPNMNESGIDDSIAFTGWNIDGWDAKIREHNYTIYGTAYSQYVFEVNISRIVFNSFMKTFLPVFFILLVVLFSFVLDPDKITTRLGMAGSGLVAAVMFHISISNQIPPVGYLTFADKFMVLTYFILLGTFIINIVLLELLERKNTELVERIHRRTEYAVFVVVPLLYLLLFLFFI
ncbi:MAG TPA: hypothetical protein VJH95_02915 [Candidatus Nanoarchaeia archaeon]|nr:hypothetical protein [Candidatus Nanoarchaeia archaeon]